MAVTQLPPEGLAEKLARGETPYLLDVREPWEFEICHLAGAVNLPLGLLARQFDPTVLPEGREVVVICHHGMRSLQAAMWLQSRGVEGVLNLAGGIDRWAATVDPAMARY
ncbi:rhodanese-like domain-containing protein [Zavarzinia sp.]|uniref:rhodanese-like domain-containing protein n=1 Tax=Zavarzinia sp. TaxID=2027920 RepID=UPI00356B373F